MFNAVISMVVMWCLCICTLTKADFHRLDVSMLSMICSMVRLRRWPGEEWIPFYIRRRRHARQVLKDHQINLCGVLELHLITSSGHSGYAVMTHIGW